MKRTFCLLCFLIFGQTWVFAQMPRKENGMTAADRAVWFNKLKWDSQDALASDQDRFENAGFKFISLNDRRWLVEIITGAGAYQFSYVFAILDERFPKTVRSLTFTEYYLDEHNQVKRQRTRFLSGRSSFDRLTNTLQIYYKGRGIGDCGSLTTFKVLANPVRTVKSRLRSCDLASSDVPPEKWDKIRLW